MGAASLANGGGGRHWSAEHDAAPACQKAARPAVVPSQSQSPQAPSLKKPRVELRSSTVVPSFKVCMPHLLTSIMHMYVLVRIGIADVFLVLMARLLEYMQPYSCCPLIR